MAVSETLPCSLLPSPLDWPLLSHSVFNVLSSECALGACFFRHLNSNDRGSLAWWALWILLFAKEQSDLGARKGTGVPKLEHTGLRKPGPSWATEASHLLPRGAQKTILDTYRSQCGKLGLLGKSLSYSYRCHAETEVQHIVREFQGREAFSRPVEPVLSSHR